MDIQDEHAGSDEVEQIGLMAMTIFEYLLEEGLIDPEKFERKYNQVLSQYDQDTAESCVEIMRQIRNRCPRLSDHMDSHYGDEWGPENVCIEESQPGDGDV
jgi:hypothetical protein